MPTTGYPPQVHRIAQFGKETTFGTEADANRKLFSFDVDIDPNIPITKVMAQGSSSPVGAVVGKEFTKVGLKGEAAFDDLLYVWDCCLKAAVITTPGGGVNTRRWTYTPSTTAVDTINSLTVEYGDATINASLVTGVQWDSVELDFKPDKTISVKIDGYGKSISDGITMTNSPTAVTLRTMSPREIDVYLDTTFGNIGTTQIKPAEMKFQLKDRFTPFFAINSSDTSFEANVIKSLSAGGQIVVPHNSDSNGYMTQLKNGTTTYLSVVVVGDLIEGSLYYKMTINMPIVYEKNSRGPNQDTHCATYDFFAVDDTTAGYSLQVIHDTQRTAL